MRTDWEPILFPEHALLILEECYKEHPIPVVVDSKATGPERVDAVLRDSSAEGIWGGTGPRQRRAVEHLPVPLRIEILLRRVRLEQLNGSAPSRLVSCAGEIVTTWTGLGSPPEAQAETFRHVATAYGGSTITAARRRLRIVAERDAAPGTGRVDRWQWRFSNVRV